MNLIDSFFKLGDKVTKGDPIRKLLFDYILLWIMFIAFCTIFYDNVSTFILNWIYNDAFLLSKLGWSFVMLAILWFQYHGLKSVYEMRKNLNSKMVKPEPNEQSMLNEFEEKKLKTCEVCGKEVQDNIDVCNDCIKKNNDTAWYKKEK